MENAQESPAPQADNEIADDEKPAFVIAAQPALASDLEMINWLDARRKHWSRLADMLEDECNWPVFFKTMHDEWNCYEVHRIIAKAMQKEFRYRAETARARLRRLHVLETKGEAHGYVSAAASALTDHVSDKARTAIADVRAEMAALREKLAAAEEARKQAETKARSAVARSAAAKRASKRAANAAPKRKPARKKR